MKTKNKECREYGLLQGIIVLNEQSALEKEVFNSLELERETGWFFNFIHKRMH